MEGNKSSAHVDILLNFALCKFIELSVIEEVIMAIFQMILEASELR